MQTHLSTAPQNAEPFFRTIGAYVQVEVPFRFGKVWLIGRVIARDGDVVTIFVNGNKVGTQISVDTSFEASRLKPFVIA